MWLGLFYFAFVKYAQVGKKLRYKDFFVQADYSFLAEDEGFRLEEGSGLEVNEQPLPVEEVQASLPEEKDPVLAEAQGSQGNFFEEEVPSLCGLFPCYSSTEFSQLFRHFEKDKSFKHRLPRLYSDLEIDEYLRAIAEGRGYERHSFAKEENLVSVGEYQTQRELKDAYLKMKDEMKQEGIFLHFVSGYRSFEHQKKIFQLKMGPLEKKKLLAGGYDEHLMEVLNLSALPGYSKHHSGYAVDFGCGDRYLVYEFASTPCYKWMSENNFENAKRFGFIPSYPNGLLDQGPNPEPWEYLWVGQDMIKNKILFE